MSIKKYLIMGAITTMALLISGCAIQPNVNPNATKAAVSSGQSSVAFGKQSNDITIDKDILIASSTLELNKSIKTDSFTFSVPDKWKVTNSSDTVYFNFNMKSKHEDYDGGIYRQEYDVNSGESMPEIDELLQWILPNHTETESTSKISGLFADTYLLKVLSQPPAASKDTTTTTWTYIIFVDKNKSTDKQFIAYELFFKTTLASQSDAVKIANSFRLL